jgi:glycosyltransferase involved in cell wall biosynthesis
VNWAEPCAAIIPCYNEATDIGPLVEGVRRFLPRVIVVDDGSPDATAARGREAGADVLRHDRNRGKGAALTTGWRHARELGFAWALALDGDGQHAPADIPAFFRCAEETGAQLVVGNRLHDAGRMPWVRRQVNRWMSRQISRRAGRPLPDTQSGFRLMNLAAWSALSLETTHFEIESEVLLAFVRAGHKVEFVPIQVLYKGEQSKIHPLADTVRWWRWWNTSR